MHEKTANLGNGKNKKTLMKRRKIIFREGLGAE